MKKVEDKNSSSCYGGMFIKESFFIGQYNNESLYNDENFDEEIPME